MEPLASHPDKHLTAEEIYDKVKQEYPEIGLATVYRTVQLLLELRFLEQLEAEIKGKLDFRVADHEVKLYGYCGECADK